MKNLTLIFLPFTIWIMLYSCNSSNGENINTLPNFIIILVDDLGYGDLNNHHTPNIDHLSQNGLTFTNFHSASLCTPTRVSLLTGKYPQSFGDEFERALTLKYEGNIGLPHDYPTIFELLQKKGYITGIIGKWHLGWMDEFNPLTYGFDHWIGCKSGEIDYHSKINGDGEYDWYKNNIILKEEGYVTDLIARHATSFIEKNEDQSFALYIPFTAPHTPFQGPNDPAERFIGGVDNIDWPKNGSVIDPERAYRDMIVSLDSAIGNIIKTLQEEQLEEKTLIVFVSDNGAGDFIFASNGRFRGFKGGLFEGGTRVTCVMHWKDHIKKRVSNELVHITDIPKTLGTIAKTELEGDGCDLSDLIFNMIPLDKREIFQRRTYRNGGKEVSVTSENWKYIRTEFEEEFLFNLTKDLEESYNLTHTYPDTAKNLATKLLTWESKY